MDGRQGEDRRSRVNQHDRRGELFTVFIKGIHESLSFDDIGDIFINVGRVRDIYVPRHPWGNWKTRSGFVRFEKENEMLRAIKLFDAIYVRDCKWSVQKSKSPRNGPLKPRTKRRYVEEGQRRKWVYVPRKKLGSEGNMKKKKFDSNLCYRTTGEAKEWLKRCALAGVEHHIDAENIHEFLKSNGVFDVKVYQDGPNDVLLEFASEEAMFHLLSEDEAFWLKKFQFIKSCTNDDVARDILVWLKVWKVPLQAWEPNFFEQIGNLFGTFVCIDEHTIKRLKLDGRVLIRTPVFLHGVERINIDIDDFVTEVWVERDSFTDMGGCSTRNEDKEHYTKFPSRNKVLDDSSSSPNAIVVEESKDSDKVDVANSHDKVEQEAKVENQDWKEDDSRSIGSNAVEDGHQMEDPFNHIGDRLLEVLCDRTTKEVCTNRGRIDADITEQQKAPFQQAVQEFEISEDIEEEACDFDMGPLELFWEHWD